MLHVCNVSRHMCVCSADAWGQAIHFRSTQCLHALCPPHPSSIEALLHLQTLTKYMISLRMRKPLYLPDSNNSVLNRGGMTVSCLSTSFEHVVWHNLQYFALFFLMAWPCLFLALPRTIMCNFAQTTFLQFGVSFSIAPPTSLAWNWPPQKFRRYVMQMSNCIWEVFHVPQSNRIGSPFHLSTYHPGAVFRKQTSRRFDMQIALAQTTGIFQQ